MPFKLRGYELRFFLDAAIVGFDAAEDAALGGEVGFALDDDGGAAAGDAFEDVPFNVGFGDVAAEFVIEAPSLFGPRKLGHWARMGW